MAVENSPGRRAPVDLSLTDLGSAFTPARPIAAVRIPKRLSDGVQLPGAGVSLTPVDARGAPLEGLQGLDGARAWCMRILRPTRAP